MKGNGRKITELLEPGRGWRYHSSNVIYTERFRDGRLVAAAFQDTGVPCHARDEEPENTAFDLQVDGESLYFGWELGEALLNEGLTIRLDTPLTSRLLLCEECV